VLFHIAKFDVLETGYSAELLQLKGPAKGIFHVTPVRAVHPGKKAPYPSKAMASKNFFSAF
jgi:hypothetical protein